MRELLTRLATSVREGLDVPLSEIFPPRVRSEGMAAAPADSNRGLEIS